MPIHRLEIEDFLERSAGWPVLDVRSPKEFEHAHIPGAFSLPLFDDEERAVIGTAYKRQGRETAVNEGLRFFSATMKKIQPAALKIFEKSGMTGDPVFFVHCWRGGMRSSAVAWLLGLYGYRIFTLTGGYKSFRRWALSLFEKQYDIKILGGFTGSGKTEILQEMKSKSPDNSVIDLEGLANHKGSAFGALGMPVQPTQEMFENLLAMELWKISGGRAGKSIWMEDESRNVGKVNIPGPLWTRMRVSPLYFLEIPFEKRLEYIVQEYGKFDHEALKESVLRIRKKLGGLDTKNTLRLFAENNLKEGFRILLKHYDKLYQRSLKEHEESACELHKISSLDVDRKNAFLL